MPLYVILVKTPSPSSSQTEDQHFHHYCQSCIVISLPLTVLLTYPHALYRLTIYHYIIAIHVLTKNVYIHYHTPAQPVLTISHHRQSNLPTPHYNTSQQTITSLPSLYTTPYTTASLSSPCNNITQQYVTILITMHHTPHKTVLLVYRDL